MPRDSLVIQAPGRVNLIGEHVDYCGLPVLPMAIQYGLTFEVTPRTDRRVRLASTTADFGERTFELSTDIAPLPPGDWGNYVQAAAQALVRRVGPLHGLDGRITSNLPVASGLSSSSALVVGTARALLAVNAGSLDAMEFAALLAQGERYVGTAGGGMDHAIIVGARAGHAARIDFQPLTLAHVPIPLSWRVVVATSLAHAEKSGGVRAEYNARGSDTREARRLVALHLGADGATYRELLARHDEATLLDAAANLEPRLMRRFRHVVTEGGRVNRAVRALEAADLPAFGALLDQSHTSLATDFEVSTPALDTLVTLARRGGAAGARLTGAGFGGAAIAIVEADHVEALLDLLRREFYVPRGVEPGPGHLFVASPSPGVHEATGRP